MLINRVHTIPPMIAPRVRTISMEIAQTIPTDNGIGSFGPMPVIATKSLVESNIPQTPGPSTEVTQLSQTRTPEKGFGSYSFILASSKSRAFNSGNANHKHENSLA